MKKISVVMLFMLAALRSLSSATELSGLVRDQVTKEPIPGVLIKIKGEKTTATSAENGAFTIQTDRQKVRLSAELPGYTPWQKDVNLASGPLVIEMDLATNYTLGRVYVKDRFKIEGSKQRVSAEQITKTTTPLFSDSVKVIQTLPGVVTGDDFSSLMYVRGGEYYETVCFLDNAHIMQPYLWGGAQSVFNPTFVDKIDFYSGGYPVKYYQGMSGVLDVRNRDGDFEKKKGYVNVSFTEAEWYQEGPMTPEKSSYIFGVRRTTYDLALKFSDDKFKNVSLPFYYDSQLRMTWKLNDTDKLSLNTLTSYEGMDFNSKDVPKDADDHRDDFEFHYKNFRIMPWMNWDRTVNDRLSYGFTWTSRFNQGNADYTNNGNSKVRYSGIDRQVDMYLKNRVTYVAGRHTLEQGAYLFRAWTYTDTNVSYRTLMPDGTYAPHQRSDLFDWTKFTAGGLYTQNDIELYKDKLYLNVGGLVDHFEYTRDTIFSPRGGIKYGLTDTITLKFNTGLYSQFPVYGNDGPPPFAHNRDIKSEKSIHYVLGYEQELPSHMFLRLEGYAKDYFDRIVNDPDPSIDFTNNGKRRVCGFDLFLQRKIAEKWDGWLSYSYMGAQDRIESRNDPLNYFGKSTLDYQEPVDEWFTNSKERPHNASLVLNYEIKKDLTFAMTYRYFSGMPYTAVTGAIPPSSGATDWVPVYGKYLDERYPDYSRVDVKITMPFFGMENAEFYIQVINLMGTDNIDRYYYNDDYTKRYEVKMLPRMPVIGFKYKF